MRLEPVNNWIIAQAIITKLPGKIVSSNPADGVSRCYLIRAISDQAAGSGYKVGDIVVAKHCFDIWLYARTYHCVVLLPEEIIMRVHDVTLEEFVTVKGERVILDEVPVAPGVFPRKAA